MKAESVTIVDTQQIYDWQSFEYGFKEWDLDDFKCTLFLVSGDLLKPDTDVLLVTDELLRDGQIEELKFKELELMIMNEERIELIRVEDVFQITGRGSVLAGCFKGSMDDKRLRMLKDADLVITDIAENEIEMKLMGFEIMRNHYINWEHVQQFTVGILVDIYITSDMFPRFSPLMIIRRDSIKDQVREENAK